VPIVFDLDLLDSPLVKLVSKKLKSNGSLQPQAVSQQLNKDKSSKVIPSSTTVT
jgi:hypothetical protein